MRAPSERRLVEVTVSPHRSTAGRKPTGSTPRHPQDRPPCLGPGSAGSPRTRPGSGARGRVPRGACQAGHARGGRPHGPPLLRVRAPEGVVVLPDRRRLGRPDPGGARRPLQGDPRLPLRPRVELSQLRRAVHHEADHHRSKDRDAQQAHAAELVRVVQPDARVIAATTASRRLPTCCRARRCTTRSTR